jgi:O-antigen/teichoic acid export membrane protein
MLARSVTLNILGQAATLAIGFFASIALARWLGPTDRGLLGVITSVSNVALALGSIGLPIAVWYYASREHARFGELLGNTFLWAGLLAVVCGGGFWLLRDELAAHLSHGEGGNAWVLGGFVVSILFLDYTTHNQLLGQLRFGLVNLLVVLSKIAYLICVVVLVGRLDLGVSGALVAVAAGSIVVTVGSTRTILQWARPRIDLGLFRMLLRYGSRIQIGSIFQLLNYRLDVVILTFFVPLSSVGYYVVAQTLAELVLTLARAFQGSVLSLVSHYEGDERQNATTRASLRHHGILAFAAMLANAVFGPLVIVFGYGDQFRPAIVPFLILLPGMWFLGAANVVTGDLSGRGRPGAASALSGGAVVVTVILDLLLIPHFGVPGAAVASLIAYTCFGIASLIVLSRVARIHFREVLPTRDDLRAYPAAVRPAMARLRARRQPS